MTTIAATTKFHAELKEFFSDYLSYLTDRDPPRRLLQAADTYHVLNAVAAQLLGTKTLHSFKNNIYPEGLIYAPGGLFSSPVFAGEARALLIDALETGDAVAGRPGVDTGRIFLFAALGPVPEARYEVTISERHAVEFQIETRAGGDVPCFFCGLLP